MVVSVELNKRFLKLNSNAFRNKADFRTRERRAIVDITIPNNETYAPGGLTVDFSKIRNFIEVYGARVLEHPVRTGTTNIEFRFITATDNDASNCKLMAILIASGSEVDGLIPGPTVITAEIIGI